MKLRNTIRTILCLGLVLGSMTSCLSDLNQRVDALEEQVTGLLSSVSQIEDYIKSQIYVSQVSSNEDGYVLTLSNGDKMQIRNGKNGVDGVSVVDGIAGIKGVSISDDYVIFSLEDGGTLVLSRKPRAIEIIFTSAEVNAYDGKAYFEVKDVYDPYVMVSADAGMKFELSDIVDGKGCISFTRGTSSTDRIYATVIDNASAGCNTNTKVLKVNFETSAFNTDITGITLGAEGGELTLRFSTNCPYTLELPQWISTATKALSEHTEKVYVSANTGKSRNADIRVIDSNSGKVAGSVNVRQFGEQASLYILSEGQYGANNASLSRYDFKSKTFTHSVFSTVNKSTLGDTANDIIVTSDNIIIAVNGSNIIQFCDSEGKAVAQTEDVPQCRKMAVDASGEYLYVTSYAENGYVAKIDLTSYKVVGKTDVGYEPEGIVWYDGKLYVANSGGSAYLGTHDYEQSISVVDARTMKELKRVDTGLFNLYGAFVQSDSNSRYILGNASGDYMSRPAGSFVFDCDTDTVLKTFSFPATYASVKDGVFHVLGSSFSYATYAYEYSFKTVSVSDGKVEEKDGLVSQEVEQSIKSSMSPYGIFMAHDGRFFISDAGDYMNRGTVTVFSPEGKKESSTVAGVCPGHFFEQ